MTVLLLLLAPNLGGVGYAQERPESAPVQNHLSIDSTTGFLTDDAGTRHATGPAGRFDASYVVLELPENLDFGQDVSDRFRTDVLLGYQFDFLRVGVDVPLYPGISEINAEETALGSPALDLRGTIVDGSAGPIGIGLSARGWLGTTATDLLPTERDDGGFEGALVVSDHWKDGGAALNLGWREVDFDPNEGDMVGDAFVARGALRGEASEAVALFLDGEAALRYDRDQIADDEGWVAGQAYAGAAFALTEGLGLEARVGSYLHQARDAGDRPFDPAAGIALTWAGKERTDADLDGITNFEDECAGEAEDLDGYLDMDGCPDSLSRVVFQVTGADGQTLSTYDVRVDGRAIDMTGMGSEPGLVFLEPGHRRIEIDAAGFQTTRVGLDVSREGNDVAVQLAPWPQTVVVERVVETRPRAEEPQAEEPRTTVKFGERIRFATNSATLDGYSKRLLDRVARRIGDHPEIEQLWIEGHSDRRGSSDYNELLSLRRAMAVRDYLVDAGVPSRKLKAVGFGERDPIAVGDFIRNRRVEFSTRLDEEPVVAEPETDDRAERAMPE